MRRSVIPGVLALVGCADVHQALEARGDGQVSWQLRVSPTGALPAGLDPESVIRRIAPPGQNDVRAWIEADPQGRSWLVVHARAPDVGAWAAWRRSLVATFPDTPDFLLPPQVLDQGLRLNVLPGPDPGPGTWSLTTRGFITENADQTSGVGEGHWRRSLPQLRESGLEARGTFRRHPLTPPDTNLAALASGAAGLFMLGWVMKRWALRGSVRR